MWIGGSSENWCFFNCCTFLSRISKMDNVLPLKEYFVAFFKGLMCFVYLQIYFSPLWSIFFFNLFHAKLIIVSPPCRQWGAWICPKAYSSSSCTLWNWSPKSSTWIFQWVRTNTSMNFLSLFTVFVSVLVWHYISAVVLFFKVPLFD